MNLRDAALSSWAVSQWARLRCRAVLSSFKWNSWNFAVWFFFEVRVQFTELMRASCFSKINVANVIFLLAEWDSQFSLKKGSFQWNCARFNLCKKRALCSFCARLELERTTPRFMNLRNTEEMYLLSSQEYISRIHFRYIDSRKKGTDWWASVNI